MKKKLVFLFLLTLSTQFIIPRKNYFLNITLTEIKLTNTVS